MLINLWYRQVTNYGNKHEQFTPCKREPSTICSFTMNVWRYSATKNKSKSSIPIIFKHEQKRWLMILFVN